MNSHNIVHVYHILKQIHLLRMHCLLLTDTWWLPLNRLLCENLEKLFSRVGYCFKVSTIAKVSNRMNKGQAILDQEQSYCLLSQRVHKVSFHKGRNNNTWSNGVKAERSRKVLGSSPNSVSTYLSYPYLHRTFNDVKL